MFADDLGAACVFLMLNHDKPDIINIGTGEEVSILELAHLIADAVGFKGKIGFDKSKPDGKTEIDHTLCNGCTMCVQICPFHAIEEVTGQ